MIQFDMLEQKNLGEILSPKDLYQQFRPTIYKAVIEKTCLPKNIPQEVFSSLKENLESQFNQLKQEYQRQNSPSPLDRKFCQIVSNYYQDFAITVAGGLSVDEVNTKIGFPVYLYFNEEMRRELLKIKINKTIAESLFVIQEKNQEYTYQKSKTVIQENKEKIESILDNCNTFTEAMNALKISRYKFLKILNVIDPKYLEYYRSNFEEILKDLEGMKKEERYQYFENHIDMFISVIENDGISIGEIIKHVAKNYEDNQIYKMLKKYKDKKWIGKYTYAKNCKYYVHKKNL